MRSFRYLYVIHTHLTNRSKSKSYIYISILIGKKSPAQHYRYTLPPCHIPCSQREPRSMLCRLHKLQEKTSYGMRKCLRKFLGSLESRCFSSGVLRIIDHGAREKSDRGQTCRLRLTRGPSPSLLSSSSAVSISSSTSGTRAHSVEVLALRRFS